MVLRFMYGNHMLPSLWLKGWHWLWSNAKHLPLLASQIWKLVFFVFSAGKLNIFGFLSVVLGKTSSLNEITCVLGNFNGHFSLIFDMLSTKCSIQEIIGRKPDNDNNNTNLSCSTVRFSVQLTPKEELSLKDTCVLPFPFIIRYLMRLHILFNCQCSHLLNLNIYTKTRWIKSNEIHLICIVLSLSTCMVSHIVNWFNV